MRRPSWETSSAWIMLSSQKGSLAAEHLSQEQNKSFHPCHFLSLYTRSNFTTNACEPQEVILSRTFYVKNYICNLFLFCLIFDIQLLIFHWFEY